MIGRPRLYENDELIEKVIEIFCEKGYSATSVHDLMKVMRIGQGTFYHSFPGGKKELYHKSLSKFLDITIAKFYDRLDQSNDPIEFIKEYFFSTCSRSAIEQRNGCYLGNTIVELSNLDEETKLMSVNLLKELKTGFEKALSRAQDQGLLDSDKPIKTIAFYLINLWNGINITQRMGLEANQVKEVLDLSLEILD